MPKSYQCANPECSIEIIRGRYCCNKCAARGRVLGVAPPSGDLRQVIEIFGDYWHTPEEAKKVVRQYRLLNIDCLILWYSQMTSKSRVLSKVAAFCPEAINAC